jgi:hypothetical protein
MPLSSRHSQALALMIGVVPKHVSFAANCMQQGLFVPFIDLRTQPRNMHLDHVGLRIEMIIQARIDFIRARENYNTGPQGNGAHRRRSLRHPRGRISSFDWITSRCSRIFCFWDRSNLPRPHRSALANVMVHQRRVPELALGSLDGAVNIAVANERPCKAAATSCRNASRS